MEPWVFLTIGIGTIIGTFGAMFLKKGADNLSFSSLRNIITTALTKNIIFGIILYVISSVFYIISLRGGELSLIYPLLSVSYIWILIISRYCLNEDINKYKIIGVALIILGITVMHIT